MSSAPESDRGIFAPMAIRPLRAVLSTNLVSDAVAAPVAPRRTVRGGALAALVLGVGLMGSGCYGNIDRTLTAGNFVARDDASLAIEVDPKGGKLIVKRGEAAETRDLKAWPQEKWPVHCRKNMSADRLETFDIDGGALELGKAKFDKPLLSVDCGGDKTVRIGNATGDERGLDMSTSVVFDRK